MKKGLLYGSIIFFAGILMGGSSSMLSCGPVPVEGLILIDGTSSICYDEYNSSNYYVYSFTLYNGGPDDIYISPDIVKIQNRFVHDMNEYLEAGSSITVKGKIELFSKNVSKETIMDIGPVSYLNVSYTQMIPFPV